MALKLFTIGDSISQGFMSGAGAPLLPRESLRVVLLSRNT